RVWLHAKGLHRCCDVVGPAIKFAVGHGAGGCRDRGGVGLTLASAVDGGVQEPVMTGVGGVGPLGAASLVLGREKVERPEVGNVFGQCPQYSAVYREHVVQHVFGECGVDSIPDDGELATEVEYDVIEEYLRSLTDRVLDRGA